MRKLEILAPAGSQQSLEAAVYCGADAVYLGIDCLNARRGAENFTAENLAETVRFCHIRGVKVYLTLNIVVLENEIPQFLKAARTACEAGVDAVIVQDLGAAALLRRCCPGLRLNASTQMAVHNPEGARLLEEMGFSRVVLARECSGEETAAIARAVSIEVETFVHGALCMCVSGQCYMSSVLGQRSGNRGLCAQPCRLDFRSAATGHALSLRDLCLIPRLDELAQTGVASLKIEGRMKRPEYVAAAVTACRAAMDGEPVDLDALQAVFSRSGFTDGYFTGKRDLEMFGFRQKEDVTAAAGVLGKLENLYTDPRKQVQKVDVELSFSMKAGQRCALAVLDSDGNSVRAEGAVPEPAVNRPTDPERARASLAKTGGTPYHVKDVLCDIDGGLMLPASAVNALRRSALEKLDEVRGKTRQIPFAEAKAGPLRKIQHAAAPKLRVRLDRMEQLGKAMLDRAELVTLPVAELERLLAQDIPLPVEKLCAGLPRMLFEGQAGLLDALGRLRERGIKHACVGNLGSLKLALGLGFILHGEPFFNAVNSYSCQILEQLGLSDLCLSFELSLDGAKRLQTAMPFGLTVYGALPLMTVRNCPVKAAVGCKRCREGENFITDRKGARLHTTCAYGCSELLNPVPLYMGDRMSELAGVDFAQLRFTTESPGDCEQILKLYQSGGEFHGKFTRGLLYKNIL